MKLHEISLTLKQYLTCKLSIRWGVTLLGTPDRLGATVPGQKPYVKNSIYLSNYFEKYPV